ncbi:MAG: NAD(P)-binding domain-containing protein [Chloroflexi bacterium]|nr:NAD(P)-binding domain-containing protein [Chloroflexota bacterium]
MGTYYAKHWSNAGHELVLTYFRDQTKVERLVSQLGKQVSFSAPHLAIANSDIILFCPRFEHIEDAAKQIGDIGEAILIDANNPFNPDRTGLAHIASNQTASMIITNLFPQARHVKAFHNLGIKTILDNSNHQLIAFVASDDTDAAKIVMDLASQAHLTPLLSGGLATAGLSEFPGPLFGIPFTTIQSAHEALTKAVNTTEF